MNFRSDNLQDNKQLADKVSHQLENRVEHLRTKELNIRTVTTMFVFTKIY